MALVTMGHLLKKAHAGGYAVPAFNCTNMEMIQAALWTAQKQRSPVILGIHPLEVEHMGSAQMAVAIAKSAARGLDIEYAIHLDHGDSRDKILGAIQGGFSSVMYDGSHHPLEQNLAETRWVVDIAHRLGVTVEAEIGTIGTTDEFGNELANAHFSDPAACVKMAETGIDCVAIAIGNAHGFYKGEPKLQFELLEQIAGRVKIPLVLHGGTGIPKDQVRRAIKMGIAKMNVGAALRLAIVTGMRDVIDKDPDELNLFKIFGGGRTKLAEPITEYMDICMSIGKLDA